MKLIYRIIVRLSVCLTIILTIWAVFFYFAIMDEINDETDDMLEDYSEQIMIRALAGDTLPSADNGSNNQYFLNEVTPEYASTVDHLRYRDSMVYIFSKRETEAARILSTIFRNDDDQYFELTVSTPTFEKEDLREAILSWVIFLYLSLLVIIILVNVWIYRASMKPLHVLLTWLNKYRVGGKNEPLHNDTSIKEFQQLNTSVLQSLDRAEVAFEKQKQFIGNASHEIQTPIAVSLNRIEMLMDDDNLSEPQLEELYKTQQTLQYITKLNKSLLLLSRIDNHQFIDKRKVNINRLIKKLADDYCEIYEYLNIRFELIENGTFEIEINETLAAILFNNLMKNSYLHNVENGSIEVEIQSNGVIFKNTGSNQPLNDQSIFDRFYQGSKKKESTGLGLAIVKSICDIERLQIVYSYTDSRHCFNISRKK